MGSWLTCASHASISKVFLNGFIINLLVVRVIDRAVSIYRPLKTKSTIRTGSGLPSAIRVNINRDTPTVREIACDFVCKIELSAVHLFALQHQLRDAAEFYDFSDFPLNSIRQNAIANRDNRRPLSVCLAKRKSPSVDGRFDYRGCCVVFHVSIARASLWSAWPILRGLSRIGCGPAVAVAYDRLADAPSERVAFVGAQLRMATNAALNACW